MRNSLPAARRILFLTLSLTLTGVAACEVGSGRSAPPRMVGGAPPGPMQQAQIVGAPGPAEAHGPNAARQVGSAPLYLPGSPVREMVNFEVVNGLAVMEGDIVLGPPQTLAFSYGMPRIGSGYMKGAVTLADKSHLWVGGDIPYAVEASVSPKQAQDIQWAIGQVNETQLNVRPKTDADKDYVSFRDTGPDCSSYLGRIGGRQTIQIGGCGKGSIIHEILHAAGFYHEQSRGDRDEHVTIMWDEIVPSYQSAFRKRDGRGQDIGPYDFASVMHYSERAFSKRGKPTIVTKVPGTPIGQRKGLSVGDKAAIAQLYGGVTAPGTPPTTTPPGTPPTTTPPGTPPTTTPPAHTGFAGNYTSQRGNVSCSEKGTSVSCQYPGGMMLCAAQGTQLECGWSGGGQGRAVFQRQSNGVLKGTFGDFFSANSRGAWDLVPAGGSAPPPSQPPPSQPPPSQPPPSQPPPSQPPGAQPPPASGPVSLTGSYSSTRGNMNCSESGTTVTCSFRVTSGALGRLDCAKDQSGLQMSCGWITYPPQPGSGRAAFSRRSTSERNFSGTFGHFFAHTGGGKWDMAPQ